MNAPWSHPIEASFPGGVDGHVAIPVHSHLSLLKQLDQVTHRLTSACATDSLQCHSSVHPPSINASQLVCPHVLETNMSLTTGSAACDGIQDWLS